MKKALYILLGLSLFSCTSTKNTIKNIDYKAIKPKVQNNKYVLTQYANNPKYGYDKDYPINLGFGSTNTENYFVQLFFNGITDEDGNPVKYEKIDTCCPFATKHNTMGVGLLYKYRVTAQNGEFKDLYINIYEKGEILCPNGFKISQ